MPSHLPSPRVPDSRDGSEPALGSAGDRVDRRPLRRLPARSTRVRSCRPWGPGAPRPRAVPPPRGVESAPTARTRPSSRTRTSTSSTSPPRTTCTCRTPCWRSRRASTSSSRSRWGWMPGRLARSGRGRGAAGVFCMEAMWTLFLPRYDVVRQLARATACWVTCASSSPTWASGSTTTHRIMRPELAGGPLLDLGTYPVTLATWALGAPAGSPRWPRRRGTPRGSRRGRRHQRPARDGARDGVGRDGILAVHHAHRHPDHCEHRRHDRAASTSDGPFYRPGPVALRLRDGTELLGTSRAVGHARTALRGRRGRSAHHGR